MKTCLAVLALVAAAPLAAAAPTPPANVDPKVAAQVPVIAGKLETWRGTWAVVGGKLGCKTLRSSGDQEIDALGCAATLACIRPAYPALRTIAESKASEADRKRQMAAKLASLRPCLAQHRGQGIAELAVRRARG